jgi:hypothetical protein
MKDRARQIIRSEMAKRDLSYIKLAEMMNQKGYKENQDTLRTKINRGTFSFYFFLQFCESLDLEFKIKDRFDSWR